MCKDSNVGRIFSNDVYNSEIAKCPFGLSRQVGVSTVSYIPTLAYRCGQHLNMVMSKNSINLNFQKPGGYTIRNGDKDLTMIK